ncbi:hypothetical protein CDV31_003611 [Fusarium ambrosium]|uniref:Uncharacterized protein n=1 Tax=Fusarium ambrosium TaxID=131363 RepID=A0A428UTB4_9HYPO|nr:hypothetical protein CDV31_003611 [Fusarium ambrosium]
MENASLLLLHSMPWLTADGIGKGETQGHRWVLEMPPSYMSQVAHQVTITKPAYIQCCAQKQASQVKP